MARLRLFEGFGVELEYMLVDRDTLDVRPVADRLLAAVAGSVVSEVERGATAWSNELAQHVIEFKTNGPAPSLEGLTALFQADVAAAASLADDLGARLMPGAMHPWMDPERELVLWAHEYSPVYEAFHRIFDCRGHGWANLQSVHLNLPFADDEEFARLHAAVRLVLPILPALAASSPVADGLPTGAHDTRLVHYRGNCRRVPSVTGHVVPETVSSRREYEERILGRIYADLAPFDPEGVLRHEWANARGCIARFDRWALEIRLLDVQEHPGADIAICAAIVAVLRALVDGRWPRGDAPDWPPERLDRILQATTAGGETALVEDDGYLTALGYPGARTRAGELWSHLVHETVPADAPERPALDVLLSHGTLATRLLAALGPDPDRTRLRRVYADLCRCLVEGRPFP